MPIDGRRLESVEQEFGEVDWDNVPQPFASLKFVSTFQVVKNICSAKPITNSSSLSYVVGTPEDVYRGKVDKKSERMQVCAQG